jgi:hypothetical protein
MSMEQLEIIKAMSPTDKLRISGELYDLAWQLKSAGLRDQHPDWTDDEIFAGVRTIFLYART